VERQQLTGADRRGQLVGELTEIVALVGGCRRQLCDGDACEADTRRHRDVDVCLQHVEHLLSALRRDVTGDVTRHDRSAAAGRALDEQLRKSTRDNMQLRCSVERLESDVRRLRGHNVALTVELDRLRDAVDHFRVELGEFLPDSGSVDVSSVTAALREIKNNAQQLQTTNSTLQAKVTQLEHTSVYDSAELKAKIDELEAERETLLKRENELRLALELSQHVSEPTSPLRTNTDGSSSRIDRRETQLSKHRDTCTATKFSRQREQEVGRKVDDEKEQLIRKIGELELEAKKKEDELNAIRDQLDQDNSIIRRENDALTRKIPGLETTVSTDWSTVNDQLVSQENARLREDVEALNEAIRRQSELILKMDEKLRHHRHHQQQQHSHGTDSGTASALVEELKLDSASEEVAELLARLQDQSSALETALALRDALCCDLDAARTHNARLSSVVRELSAECDRKDSDVERLGAQVTQLEQRLADERREFVDAVELVRRQNAADSDRIAEDNRRLATLLNQLELTCAGNITSPKT